MRVEDDASASSFCKPLLSVQKQTASDAYFLLFLALVIHELIQVAFALVWADSALSIRLIETFVRIRLLSRGLPLA